MRRILDSSALLTGREFPGELFTVPEVLDEVERHGLTPQLEAFLATHVAVVSPGPDPARRVRDASRTTGDEPRLSPTDVAVLALAVDLGGTVVTDDYSIQNVCQAIGVPYETAMAPGIRDRWTWAYRCTGCGRTWPTWHEACPTCGARLRTARRPDQPR